MIFLSINKWMALVITIQSLLQFFAALNHFPIVAMYIWPNIVRLCQINSTCFRIGIQTVSSRTLWGSTCRLWLTCMCSWCPWAGILYPSGAPTVALVWCHWLTNFAQGMKVCLRCMLNSIHWLAKCFGRFWWCAVSASSCLESNG